jgi:hypothetical protein
VNCFARQGTAGGKEWGGDGGARAVGREEGKALHENWVRDSEHSDVAVEKEVKVMACLHANKARGQHVQLF